MGKNQHSKDRLFLTATEWRELGGGKRVQIGSGAAAAYRPLAFDCCALSLTPFSDPVCAPEGQVFDVSNIVQWVKKHHSNPVTGTPLAVKDLVPLKFHKNSDGLYHCPVTFKVFGPHSHIVAIKPTGNVYAFEAVDELCLKPRNFKDLLTEEAFSKKTDLLTIQDPSNPALRDVNQFHFIKTNERLPSAAAPTVTMTDSARRILEEVSASAESRKADSARLGMAPSAPSSAAGTDAPAVAGAKSSGACAASFTSTDMDIVTRFVPQVETEADRQRARYDKIKTLGKKGYVQLTTSLGNINLELACDLVPKTCENFLLLCKRGYYNGVKFHRLIPNFMIQGGDPTGTGRGGESAFGGKFEDEFHPKLLHDARGVLSMANSGPATNGSQFFITFRPTTHLNNKHSVFGRVVGGLALLAEMEAIDVDKSDKPKTDIVILSTNVFVDPYQELESIETEEAEKAAAEIEAEAQRVAAVKAAAKAAASREALAGSSAIGKYMAVAGKAAKRPRNSDE